MNLLWLAETIAGSAISWAVFAGLTWIWAKRTLVPIWHQHVKPALAALAAREPD